LQRNTTTRPATQSVGAHLEEHSLTTETNTPANYSYYIDVEGYGAPRYGTLDFQMLSEIAPKHRGKIKSAIFVDRIVGINLRRETRAALYGENGELITQLELKSSGKPRRTKPSKWFDMQEDLTYRFEFESEEPIDFETFDVQAITHERHGGSFMTAIEINGCRIDPARFHDFN
jgi:hypothetical protein